MRPGTNGIVLAAIVAALGCDGPQTMDDAGIDTRVVRWIVIPDAVDLLFVVDNSNSMAEEQASLVAELPRLVRVLVSGDEDGDGEADFNPVRTLHIGMVTPDLGAGPNRGVPTCDQGLGDDGILRDTSRLTTTPCRATYPSGTFEFERDNDDPAAFADEVACVLNLGTGGCGFEQQLEAGLKALTPLARQAWTRAGYVPPRFLSAEGEPDRVGGNGEGPNAGFLRAASVLAVVVVSDEEDCSVLDYDLFVADEPRFAGMPLNLRCSANAAPELGLLHPTQRYVDGFLGLRRDPSFLVFAAIVGIPPETEPSPGAAIDFDALGRHPAMVVRTDAAGTNLAPSCENEHGVAYPPTRFVRVAEGLAAGGAHVSMSSICATDFEPAISDVIDEIARSLRLD